REWPELDIDEGGEGPGAEALAAMAAEAEAAALDVKGVTNSGGAGAHWGRSAMALVTSEGFIGGYSGTSSSVSCSVLAGEGTAMERDYEHSSARHSADLDPA